MKKHRNSVQGFTLVTTMFFMLVVVALLGSYLSLTRIELATTRYSKNSMNGFYAAEAGLNVRAETIKQIFVGYNRPTGSPPTEPNACEGSNLGSGDFSCASYTFSNQNVTTYATEDAANPIITTIPPGERYQNLNAQEYRYDVRSIAENKLNEVEAILELRFKSRLVPMFQFVAFYDKDLEILPGPTMVLSGPIHTNGDLYLDAGNSLGILGQVTTAEDLYRGRKNNSDCSSRNITVPDPTNPLAILPSCSTRTKVTDVSAWNGMIQTQVVPVTVPVPEIVDPDPASPYFADADLRLALHLDAANNPDTSNSSSGIEVRNSDNSLNSIMTNVLNNTSSCSGSFANGLSVTHSNTFYNNREGKQIQMLDVSLQDLLDCLYSTGWLGASTHTLDDSSHGGLVFHLTVDGPDSTGFANPYGVRVRNAAEIKSTNVGAPLPQGLTFVTDQAVYLYGDYNATNKIPSSFLADTFNVLSANWNDANSTNWSARNAVNTTINAAILAGTDTTGGLEGAAGQGGAYNGGLENYPRLHENWSGRTLTYRGSFVSLNQPRRQNGAWSYGSPQYTAPGRAWDYDTDFNNANNLPPMSPRFVYLRQELFVRDFEQ